jgi:NTP pyrophosphatase (non-canonical NTP hydrolase)
MEVRAARTRAVLDEVDRERSNQDKKWGEQNHPNLYWLGILMEEVGETAKALIEDGHLLQIRGELIQVAAVAVAWVEKIDRRNA